MTATQTIDAAAQLADFAACVFAPDDVIEIRRLPSKRSSWHKASELGALADTLTAENADDNLYIGGNPRRDHGGTTADDVVMARCLFADFDHTTIEQAQERWKQCDLPNPTLVLSSGHGVHAYWRLSEPMTDLVTWSQFQRDLAAALASDPLIHDSPRIMRLPGFTNHKPPAADCRILTADPGRVFDLVDLVELIPEVLKPEPPPSVPQVATTTVGGNLDALARAAAYARKWPPALDGTRNAEAMRHAAVLTHDFALTDSEALPILSAWNGRNPEPLGSTELRNCLANGRQYGTHPVGAKLADVVQPERTTTTTPAETVTGLDVVNASTIQPEHVSWLWDGRLPRGKLSIICGDPKSGKSVLACDLTARITTGAPFPDRLHVGPRSPAPVIILSGEDDPADTIVPRLIHAHADLTRVELIRGCTDPKSTTVRPFRLDTDLYRLETLLDQHPATAAIFIDPLGCFLGDIDSHRNAEVRALLAPLGTLAAKYRVAVVCICHLTKGNLTTKTVYRISGSLGFAAASRATWLVIRDPEDAERRLLLNGGCNLVADNGGLAYTIQPSPDDPAVPVVAWELDPVHVTADQALEQEVHAVNQSGALAETVAWLRNELASGPVLSRVLDSRANAEGISVPTLKRARALLKRTEGLRSIPQRDGKRVIGWLVGLPGTEQTDNRSGEQEALTHNDDLLDTLDTVDTLALGAQGYQGDQGAQACVREPVGEGGTP